MYCVCISICFIENHSLIPNSNFKRVTYIDLLEVHYNSLCPKDTNILIVLLDCEDFSL